MPEPIANSRGQSSGEPLLRRAVRDPKGVLQKNLKPILYLGAALLVIAAAIFSSSGKKTPSQQAEAKHQPPQPMLQDNTDNNVQDLKNQVEAAQQKAAHQASNTAPTADPILAAPIPPQQAAVQAYGPGQQQGAESQQQLTPAAQEEQELAAKDRALAYDSRFASNLAYARPPDLLPQRQQTLLAQSSGATSQQSNVSAYGAAPTQTASSLIPPRVAGDPPSAPTAQTTAERRPEVNIDAALGQPYVIYEGTTLDTVLMNRLDGDAAGPVKVLVSNPIYSHDRQHILIPEGTIALGEAKKIGAAGFGQQRRVALVFHRLIMPDGYSVDLDQFHGLDQIGEEGMKDKVNNHYLQIFGTSIALGVIAGAGEIEQGGGTISTSGSQAFTTGTAGSVSQSATTVLDRFMQIPPTITIREGHRVKVYFTQDLLLPAYENHTIPQTY